MPCYRSYQPIRTIRVSTSFCYDHLFWHFSLCLSRIFFEVGKLNWSIIHVFDCKLTIDPSPLFLPARFPHTSKGRKASWIETDTSASSLISFLSPPLGGTPMHWFFFDSVWWGTNHFNHNRISLCFKTNRIFLTFNFRTHLEGRAIPILVLSALKPFSTPMSAMHVSASLHQRCSHR